eukprot:376482_1
MQLLKKKLSLIIERISKSAYQLSIKQSNMKIKLTTNRQLILIICCVVVMLLVHDHYNINQRELEIESTDGLFLNQSYQTVKEKQFLNQSYQTVKEKQNVLDYILKSAKKTMTNQNIQFRYKHNDYYFSEFNQDLLTSTLSNKTILFYGDSTMRKYYTYLTFCLTVYPLINDNSINNKTYKSNIKYILDKMLLNQKHHHTKVELIKSLNIGDYVEMMCLSQSEYQYKFDFGSFTNETSNATSIETSTLLLPKSALLMDDIGFFTKHKTDLNEEYFKFTVQDSRNISLIYLKKHNSDDLRFILDPKQNTNLKYSLNKFYNANIVFMELGTLHPFHVLPLRGFEKNAINILRNKKKIIENIYNLSLQNNYKCVLIRSSNQICNENFRQGYEENIEFWINYKNYKNYTNKIKTICADKYSISIEECIQYAMWSNNAIIQNAKTKQYIIQLQKVQNILYFDQFSLTQNYCNCSEITDGRHFQRLYKYISFYLLNSIGNFC